MTNIESRAVRRAKRGSAVRGHSRRVAASVLSLALAFSLSPAAASWADEPGDQGSQPVEGGEPSGQGGQGSGQPGGGEEPGGEGSGTEGEGGSGGIQPFADSEDLPSLAMQVRIASDGTPGWDANSDAGNDSGPNNGIVRVNDTVTYEVEYVVSNNDAANLTWSITFPKGMEITQIPGYCQATGTSLVPATAGTPTLPLSATSIDQLSEQTLTCNMGNRSVATDKVFVTVKVLNLAHQGQDLPLLAAGITADGVEEPVAATLPLPTVKASARLMWDISKNSIALDENSGYHYGPINAPCQWDASRVCKQTTYSVLFSAPAGGKGAMPAIGNITFTDDLSPEAMYPSLSAADTAAIEADLDKYGSRITAFSTDYSQPGAKIGGTSTWNAVNSVRDSGSVSIVQAGAGEPVSFTISNADMSLRTYPSQVARPAGNALPGDAAYAISTGFTVWTPVDVIRDFGVHAGSTWTLGTYNSFTDLDIRGFDPQEDVQTSADQPGDDATALPAGVTGPVHWNDYRTTTPSVSLPGGFMKYFSGVPNAAGNMGPVEFNPGDSSYAEGPPGGATFRSGGITVAPTQQVISNLYFVGSNTALPGEVSAVGCDVWDNTKLHLTALDTPASPSARMQFVPSGGQPVWISGYNNLPQNGAGVLGSYARSADEVPALRVEYSATPGTAGASSECGDAGGPWYEDPVDVPGNDAVMEAEGIYTAVNRVRVHLVIPEPVENNSQLGAGVRVQVAIGMTVPDTGLPTGEILPNWASQKRLNFSDASMEAVLDAPHAWSRSTYDPAAHVGDPGDRLILAHAQARIDKQVRKGDSGEFSDTPPQVTGGDLVQYRLAPSLTSGAMTPGILKDVWVEDCLPGSQAYDSASLTPAVVSPGATPADAKRPACAAGETYIRWVIPNHEVNTAIEPIILSVEVSPTAADGVYDNTVVVWAKDDASTLAQRQDNAQIQIANIAGIKLEKVALTPVVQVNRPEAGTRELNRWAVRLTNTLPASEQSGVSNPDVIDVLPRQGVQGTAFNGTFTFDSATVTQGGDQTRILYTRAANVSANPQDPSNGTGGATTWCDAPAGGNPVSGVNGCPASASEVTGLRIQRSGAYLSGDVIEIELAMVGVGNRAGDVYVNRAMASAEGLDNTVGPIRRPEVAIESSIGDYVWWDLNRNGVQDQFKGDDEQPATGIPVRITGTDDLGNTVDLNTTTGEDGKYLFEQLRSSNDAGYTITFTRPDGAEFTVKAVGEDRAVDSDADPETGESDPVVLAPNSADPTIDAGLLPYGGLQIVKQITGAGGDFAAEDVLEFTVVCEFEDEPVELADPADPDADPATEVTLSVPVNGAAQVLSEVIAGIPAYADCVITETGSGSADEAAGPVEVQISWDAAAQRAGVERASLTNFYSAGTVAVSKQLTGDAKAVEYVKNVAFEVLVTCQIEEPGEGDETIRTTVYSGSVLIKGGQTKMLVTDEGDPRALPLGTRCFGEEVDTGGAAVATVDFDSFEKAAVVTAGSPDDLQQLTITAVNTFQCTEEICGKLTLTGSQLAGIVIGIAGAGIALAGLVMLALKRRRREHSVTP